MRLVLLRHAIAEELSEVPAEPGAPPPTDFDRRLTLEGRAKLRRVLRQYAKKLPSPQALYSSPLIRARQTANVAGRLLDLPVQLSDALRPGANAYHWVRALPEEHLMAVGHEPDLSQLAAKFMGLSLPPFSFKKSGMALLEGTPGHGKLAWLVLPRWFV